MGFFVNISLQDGLVRTGVLGGNGLAGERVAGIVDDVLGVGQLVAVVLGTQVAQLLGGRVVAGNAHAQLVDGVLDGGT